MPLCCDDSIRYWRAMVIKRSLCGEESWQQFLNWFKAGTGKPKARNNDLF